MYVCVFVYGFVPINIILEINLMEGCACDMRVIIVYLELISITTHRNYKINCQKAI